MDAGTTAQERPMSRDSTDSYAEKPTQGVFIGWLGIAMIALMAIVTLTLFVAAARVGFTTAL